LLYLVSKYGEEKSYYNFEEDFGKIQGILYLEFAVGWCRVFNDFMNYFNYTER